MSLMYILTLLNLSIVLSITNKAYHDDISSLGKNKTNKKNKGLNLFFTTPWNDDGKVFAKEYAKKIDILSPSWFELKPELIQGKYNTLIDGSNFIDKEWLNEIKAINEKVLIIPRFHCTGHNAETLTLLLNETNSERLIKNIIKRLKASKFDGIILECTQLFIIEELYSLYSLFQTKLYKALKSNQKKLLVTFMPYSENLISTVNKKRFEYLNKYMDYSILMTYDYLQYMKSENSNNFDVKNSPESWITQTINFYTDKASKATLLPKILIGSSFHGYILDTTDPKGMRGNIIDNKKLKDLIKIGEFELEWDKKDKEYSFEIVMDNILYKSSIPSSLTFKERVKYVEKEKLGGLFVWEIGQGFESWLDEF